MEWGDGWFSNLPGAGKPVGPIAVLAEASVGLVNIICLHETSEYPDVTGIARGASPGLV